MTIMSAREPRRWADVPDDERLTVEDVLAEFAGTSRPWMDHYGGVEGAAQHSYDRVMTLKPRRCAASKSAYNKIVPCNGVTYRGDEFCPAHGGTPNPYKDKAREKAKAKRDAERRKAMRSAGTFVAPVLPAELLDLTVRQLRTLAMVADAAAAPS